MGGISYPTYQRLGEGVRYYNMNLGHQSSELDLLPSLNPFEGQCHTDVDESLLHLLEEKLNEANALLQTAGQAALAESFNVSVKNIQYAHEGIQSALDAIEQAHFELAS